MDPSKWFKSEDNDAAPEPVSEESAPTIPTAPSVPLTTDQIVREIEALIRAEGDPEARKEMKSTLSRKRTSKGALSRFLEKLKEA
jgi:hypothetical protein